MAATNNAELIVVRGVIAGLSESDQAAIKVAAEELRALMNKQSESTPGLGLMAMALVSAEVAAGLQS